MTSPWTSSGRPSCSIFSSAREAARDARHAGVRIRGRARRVELDAVHAARELGARDLLRRRVVGEIERHQRLEVRALRQRAEDALAVVQRLLRGAHRRLAGSASRSRARSAAPCPAAPRPSPAPSRRCRCQSSGRVIVRRSMRRILLAARFERRARRARFCGSAGDPRGELRRLARRHASRAGCRSTRSPSASSARFSSPGPSTSTNSPCWRCGPAASQARRRGQRHARDLLELLASVRARSRSRARAPKLREQACAPLPARGAAPRRG